MKNIETISNQLVNGLIKPCRAEIARVKNPNHRKSYEIELEIIMKIYNARYNGSENSPLDKDLNIHSTASNLILKLISCIRNDAEQKQIGGNLAIKPPCGRKRYAKLSNIKLQKATLPAIKEEEGSTSTNLPRLPIPQSGWYLRMTCGIKGGGAIRK